VKLVASWQTGWKHHLPFDSEVAVAARTFSDGRRALGSTAIRGMIGASTIAILAMDQRKVVRRKQSPKRKIRGQAMSLQK